MRWGAELAGAINGKMIVADNLLDFEAFPWHADWYAARVREALANDRAAENYRLVLAENADHSLSAPTKEGGLRRPRTRRIEWITGRSSSLMRPPSGGEIQHLVSLTVDGGDRTEIAAGEAVALGVRAEAPPGTGGIVSVEWDFYGTGDFVEMGEGEVGERVEATAGNVYEEFCSLR